MQAYLVRRAITFVITAWLAASIAFATLLVIPGDPARIILGFDASPEAVAALERQLGLDLPPLVRYGQWLSDLARLDLGTSLVYQMPVGQLIRERLPVTLPLTAMALAIAVAIGVPLGLFAATRRGGAADLLAIAFAQAGIATPSFWLGIFLILIFAVRLRWLPAGGFTPWTQDPERTLLSLILPAVALGASRAASLTRIVRSSALEVLSADFVRTARAKGVPEGRVIRRHVLRNALVAVSTVIALEVGQLLAGAIIIESVFALPGLGALVLNAVSNRDFPLVQGIVICLAAGILVLSLITDVLYAYLDPRIRYS
ncbi:MAG: ABC transporter permease [Firmicutes bacterium]|nr:ABC transporter permease [Bacillota bacterium]